MQSVMPSGTPTYEDVSDTIEALVHIEGRRCPIPGMDFEDIAQEIRLECIRVLSFYDPTRIGPSPYKYLQTCIRNFLYNQRRGWLVPNNPPCARCPLWDRVRRTCVIEEVGCEKIIQYRENMATKSAIRQPASLDSEITDSAQERETDAMLLNESIKATLPTHLIPYYEKLVLGEKIPARTKRQIREIILNIINNA